MPRWNMNEQSINQSRSIFLIYSILGRKKRDNETLALERGIVQSMVFGTLGLRSRLDSTPNELGEKQYLDGCERFYIII
jgi:hypothetical protein